MLGASAMGCLADTSVGATNRFLRTARRCVYVKTEIEPAPLISKDAPPTVEGKIQIKTPTLPKTREEWGTQNTWKREAKSKSRSRGGCAAAQWGFADSRSEVACWSRMVFVLSSAIRMVFWDSARFQSLASAASVIPGSSRWA
jgi:hypothetical protein